MNTEADKNYKVIIKDSIAFDIYGNYNDSTKLDFEQKSIDFYGDLIISFDSIPFEFGFIELLNDKGKAINRKALDAKIVFPRLDPGNYTIRLIVDENNNKKWDTGNYGERKQPERVIYHDKSIEIKSNWDMEINWVILEEEEEPEEDSNIDKSEDETEKTEE